MYIYSLFHYIRSLVLLSVLSGKCDDSSYADDVDSVLYFELLIKYLNLLCVHWFVGST